MVTTGPDGALRVRAELSQKVSDPIDLFDAGAAASWLSPEAMEPLRALAPRHAYLEGGAVTIELPDLRPDVDRLEAAIALVVAVASRCETGPYR